MQDVQLAQLVQLVQGAVLHSSDLRLSPTHRDWSPDLGTTHSLWEVLWPPPQVLVQADHSLHSLKTGQFC